MKIFGKDVSWGVLPPRIVGAAASICTPAYVSGRLDTAFRPGEHFEITILSLFDLI